jgi:hypothetical protein
MVVIVTVYDIIAYYLFTKRLQANIKISSPTVLILLTIMELIVITISLWFVIYVQKLTV